MKFYVIVNDEKSIAIDKDDRIYAYRYLKSAKKYAKKNKLKVEPIEVPPFLIPIK